MCQTGKRLRGGSPAGMTLIELLVVMGIIAVLAGLTISGVSALKERARRNATASTLNNLAGALEQFREAQEVYPPDADADNKNLIPVAQSCYGIKNLRIALSGYFACSSCGYIYDPYRNDMVPFQERPDTWKCPTCGADKSRFARGVNYLDWLKPEQISRGNIELPTCSVCKYGYDMYNDRTLAPFQELPDYWTGVEPNPGWRCPNCALSSVTTLKDRFSMGPRYVDGKGAIVDSWGQPITYDTFFNETDQVTEEPTDAWRTDGRQKNWPKGKELIKLSAGQWVLYSYGQN